MGQRKQGKTNDKGRHTVQSFKFMGAKFRGLLGFTYSWDVISWIRRFSVLVRKLTLLNCVFVDDVISWGCASNEFHENTATTSSNDSKEYQKSKSSYLSS